MRWDTIAEARPAVVRMDTADYEHAGGVLLVQTRAKLDGLLEHRVRGCASACRAPQCCGAALYRAGPVPPGTASLGAVLGAASAESGSPHADPADIRRMSSAVLPAGRRGAIPAHEAILATPRPLAWPRSLLALERAMADPTGFLKTARQDCARRPVRERVRDWNEVYDRQSLLPIITTQAGRCMDCGIPFCHHGCPLGEPYSRME